MYVSILNVRRKGFNVAEYFVVDSKGTLSTNVIDAMVFPNEEIANSVGGKLEWLYEGQSETENIIASCDAKKIDLEEFLRLRGKQGE